MCLRINSCCGRSLKSAAIFVGIFCLLQAVGLIVAGGIFLYDGFKVGDYNTASNWDLPYRFEIIRAFGGLYLAFGALWLVMSMVYAAAIYTERPMYFLPWLVLEAISMGLALVNMISNAAIRYYGALWIIPLLLISLVNYMIVFSYYMELQDQKQRENMGHRKYTY